MGQLSAAEAQPTPFVQEFRELRNKFLLESACASVQPPPLLCLYQTRLRVAWPVAHAQLARARAHKLRFETTDAKFFSVLIAVCCRITPLLRDVLGKAPVHLGHLHPPVLACVSPPVHALLFPDLFETNMWYYYRHAVFLLALLSTGLYLTLKFEVGPFKPNMHYQAANGGMGSVVGAVRC